MAPSKKAPTVAADMPRRPEPVAPFKAHKHGVRAHGKVSKVGETYGSTKHVEVVIRHGGGDKKDPFPHDGHETRVTMPAHLAKRFPHGKQVSVHVMPRNSAGSPAEPAGPRVDADDAEGLSRAATGSGAIGRAYAKAAKKAK